MQGWAGVAGRGTNEATLLEEEVVGSRREYMYTRTWQGFTCHTHSCIVFLAFSINKLRYIIHSIARRTVPSTWCTLIGESCIHVNVSCIFFLMAENIPHVCWLLDVSS